MQNTEMTVYVLGKNKENNYNIYRTTLKEAEEKNYTAFESWMKARRYIRNQLEEDRATIMNGLFEVDKRIRAVEKLRESHCRTLNETGEVAA